MTAIGAAPHVGARRRGSARTGHVAQRHVEIAGTNGLVPRDALVDRLMAAPAVAVLVAPAGYGKSSLLRQWDAADPRPFAWLRLGSAHDDPAELTRAIAAALAPCDRALRPALDAAEGTRARRAASSLERALKLTLASTSCVLVLDDAHALRSREAGELLGRLVAALGPAARMAIASRCEPPLPLARLRAEQRLHELHVAELALTHAEVGQVAALAGLDLHGTDAELLAQRSDGWAAGVYLAGLSARDAAEPARALGRFGGDDRIVADYVREEVLAGLDPESTEFLSRTSVLERLSAPLCDHVLGKRRSAQLLHVLADRSLLVPLDRSGSEFRHHRLIREALCSRLERDDPGLAARLHARASEWYERASLPESAIEHALAAGDVERAGNLVWAQAPSLLGWGHCADIARHLRRFSLDQIAGCAPLALTAASAQLAMGDRPLVEHWTGAAERALGPGAARPLEGARLAMRSAVSSACLAEVSAAAAEAYRIADDASPWRALACLVDGAASHLTGERDHARRLLEEGARRGAALGPAIQVVCLGQLALLAIDEGEWDAAQVLATRAQQQIERVHIGDYPTAALVFAVSAAVNAHFGLLDACDRDTRHASRLLDQLGSFTPWFTAECRIALAWAALRSSDQRSGRRLLDEASYELRLVPDATVAQQWIAACSEHLDTLASARRPHAEPLTKAEMRVLQFLPTHLSFLEIAQNLYVSTNTVKTHARAVYRKLAASSRSEAVMHAREAGLLEAAV